MIPDYDVVVIDEAHELTARVTQAATDELSVGEVERTARRSQRHVEGSEADDLADAADALRSAIDSASPGRLDVVPASSPTRSCWSATPPAPWSRRSRRPGHRGGDAGRRCHPGQGLDPGAVQDRGADGRRLRGRRALDQPSASSAAVATCCASRHSTSGGPMRDKLLADKTVVLTSATLKLGGDFGALARSIGLVSTASTAGEGEGETWQGLDVGSPFDYARQAILYVAKHLPPPGRDGLGRPSSTRSSTWSTPPTVARSGCSPAGVLPRRPPRRSASGSRT